jgi:hypothetical protein
MVSLKRRPETVLITVSFVPLSSSDEGGFNQRNDRGDIAGM